MPDKLHASEFIGAWQRESISIEGREPYEDSNVLWLHAGDYFADIRGQSPATGQDQLQLLQVNLFGNHRTCGLCMRSI